MCEPSKKRQLSSLPANEDIPIPYQVGSYEIKAVFYDVVCIGHTDCYKRPETNQFLSKTFTDEREAYKYAYQRQYQNDEECDHILRRDIDDSLIRRFSRDVTEGRTDVLKKVLPKEIIEAMDYPDNKFITDGEQDEMLSKLKIQFPDEKNLTKDILMRAEVNAKVYLAESLSTSYVPEVPEDGTIRQFASGLYDLEDNRPNRGEFTSMCSGYYYEVEERSVQSQFTIPEGFALVKLADLISVSYGNK